MKVLVTGSSGFIARELIKSLKDCGHQVVGLSRSEPLNPIKGCEYLRFDLAKDNLELIPSGVDIVVHLAAQQPSSKEITWTEYYSSNVEALRRLKKFYEKKGALQFISISTTSVYGLSSCTNELNENSCVDPSTEYAISKYIGERLVKLSSEESVMQTTVLRFPSLIGRGQNGGLVDTLFNLARKNPKIEIYNKGGVYRNLLYIGDAVSAILKCLELIQDLENFEIFVIGSANSMKTIDLAELIVKKLNSSSKVIPVGKESLVDTNVFIDQTKAEGTLNFRPLSIEEGIDAYLGG